MHPVLTIFSLYNPLLPRSSRLILEVIDATTALFFSALFFAYRNGVLRMLCVSLYRYEVTCTGGNAFVRANVQMLYMYMDHGEENSFRPPQAPLQAMTSLCPLRVSPKFSLSLQSPSQSRDLFSSFMPSYLLK